MHVFVKCLVFLCFRFPKLVYHILYDCELEYNIMILVIYVVRCFTLFIAKMARDIFELIILMCSFHVKCLSKYIPRNFTDSSLLYLPIWLIASLFMLTLPFTSMVSLEDGV